jgi:hypothetical protein
MGRTFTVAHPYLLYLGPFQLSVSWELNPSQVKASRRDAKFYPRGCYLSLNTKIIWYCTRIIVTPSNGLVGTLDFFSGIALGSSRHPSKGYSSIYILHVPLVG